MARGSIEIKKYILKLKTYTEKGTLKHKHDFCYESLLEITNINKNASCDLYLKKNYYHVNKCLYCNFFRSFNIQGNGNAAICNLTDYYLKLPLIKANTLEKNYIYDFFKLINIEFIDN